MIRIRFDGFYLSPLQDTPVNSITAAEHRRVGGEVKGGKCHSERPPIVGGKFFAIAAC